MSFSIQSTLSRVMRFKTIANLAVGIQLLLAPVAVYAQENVSAAGALPYCGTDTSVIWQAGTLDNFNANLADSPAPAPSSALAAYIQTFAGSGQNSLAGFDSPALDHFMAHTFNFPEYTGLISKARLTTSLSPNDRSTAPGNADTDKIGLRFSGGTADSWERFIGSGNYVNGSPVAGLLSNIWDQANYPSGLSFSYELGSLPMPTGFSNLLNAANSNGFLDFYVQDDSSVDYVSLELCVQVPDVGDAPDSKNHFDAVMNAYAGVPANFPTVRSNGGPGHRQPKQDSWLGARVTSEADADLLPDEDGMTNIDPGTNSPNRDAYDDGVRLNTISLPLCGTTKFQYDVKVVGGSKTRYTNVWFDFNHDGDWADVLQCLSNGQIITVKEWAVTNYPLTQGAGSYLVTTPSFAAMRPCSCGTMWMRITLSESKLPATQSDGKGPLFMYGETEDYLVTYGGLAAAKLAGAVEEKYEFTEIAVDTAQFQDAVESEGIVTAISEAETTMPNRVYMPVIQN